MTPAWRAMGFAVAIMLTAAAPSPARAQTASPPAAGAPALQGAPAPSAAPPPVASTFPPQPPPATDKRGFLNDFGKWWDQSVSDFKARWKEQQSKLDDFNKQSADAAKDAAAATSEAMKSAADAMVHLPVSRVVEVQEACPRAGNGAADCAVAAIKACKAKGFNTGQPLDVRTAEKCADSLWVSGQNQTAADCPVETVVLRAACQ